jgi:nucleotide-binding universal stress UspA family protein
MKSLLAIINEPKESRDFIQYVAEMARDLKAKVTLLYAQTQISYPLGTTGSQGTAVAQVQQNLVVQQETAKKILAEHVKNVRGSITDDVSINYATELGVTSHIISDFIADRKAEMIVLEGQKDESFWMQSANNMEIIADVDCPVWIIPKACVYKPFTEIVYATDYKEEDIIGLKRLIALTQNFSPVINVLHITDSVDFEEKVKKAGFLEILQEQVSYKKITLKTISDNKKSDITELLNGYAEFIKANLIGLTKENRTFFERIFQSDQAKKIIKNASLPVLVFREKE